MMEKLFSRATRVAAIAAFLGAIGAQNAGAEPERGARRARGGFNLFASSTTVLIGNRVQCGIDNQGNTCTNVFGSPTGGGGFWPKDTPNQYIFNSGLQIAGILPPDVNPSAWAGDTVGAYIFDARGTQPQGEQLTLIFESLTASDVDNWPADAFIRDPAVYNPALVGRKTISQQDSWVRYWDGNPTLLSGRTHPMGIMIEQRTLQWNFPAGNEDIIYFIYDFTNISSSVVADYAAAFPDPAVAAGVAAIGAQYQAGIAEVLGVTIPPGGYRIDSVYAAFSIDPDVGNAGVNASTVILPFQMGIAYKTDFNEPTWFYPSDINGAPFGPFPGYVGIKYLKSPIDPATGLQVGLTMFSNTLNQVTGFPDPVGVSQLWRYLSGRVDPLQGDNACTVANPIQSRLCFLFQAPADTRFYQSSGPFSLEAGQSATIVVAAVHAAPLAAPILPFVNGTLAPGIPATGAELAVDPTLLRPLDISAGWAGQLDANLDGVISQDEVITTPRSLLAKALVAQSIFDSNFLLPFAPEAPSFFLIPADNQVTIVWSTSNTETVGDPYFDIASDPTSPLFDPNYRQLDVEGYRVYRGRTAADLQLLAQFDYAGTSLVDFIGAWDYGITCAPELGVSVFSGTNYAVPPQCPVDFTAGGTVAHDITGDMPQVRLPGRQELADGNVALLEGKLDETWPDIVIAGGFALNNSGVPFAFVDQAVTNSITYSYVVTAFDVNSVNSGPSALESAIVVQRVTPRAASPTEQVAILESGLFGDDGVELDPLAVWTIDPNTGRFNGSPPPTDQLSAAFAPLVPQLLPQLSLTARVDSLTVARFDNCPASGGNALGSCYFLWVTFDKDGVETSFSVEQPWGVWSAFGDPSLITTSLGAQAVDADPVAAARFGIPDGFSTFNATLTANLRQYIQFSAFEGQSSRRGFAALNSNLSPGGSRWFEGADETVDHPASSIRVGSVSGVDTIWAPIHHTDFIPDDGVVSSGYSTSGHMQCFGYMHGGLGRQADVELTWSGGTATLRDVTHHVDVPFKTDVQASFGFLQDNNGDGVLSWSDFDYITNVAFNLQALGFCQAARLVGATGQFSSTPVVMNVSTDGNTTDAAVNSTPPTTGTGFGLYVNGHRFIFELTGGAVPADGTVWTLRSHHGIVSASNDESSTPTAYLFSQTARSPIIPGLQVQFNVAARTAVVASDSTTLAAVHTVPDPYYVTNFMETTPSQKILKFVNLPPQAMIRIYSVSGILVDVVEHDDPSFGGEAIWDVRNRNDQFVASGVYFYHLETPEGLERIGRFTVVNSSGLPSASAQ